jgi:hypothetical protein
MSRESFLADISDKDFWVAYEKCLPYSLLTIEKFYNLYSAVHYVCDNRIIGDMVECGVWKGGAVLMIADILSGRGLCDRDIFLYDTFEGFVERSVTDVSCHGKEIGKVRYDNFLAEVQRNLAQSNYPKERLHFIAGDVRETATAGSHELISLLRLDTDTYATTLHELQNLYDRVTPGGVVIIDDYGYSVGCRKAVDEFFQSRPRPLFQRPNQGCRTAIKIA